ncbi:MAG: hypothetical protein ABSF64_40425 [Bryobacteraceae bacterium]
MLPGRGLSATTSGGSLISKVAVQGPLSANYEVNITVALNASDGDYAEYLRATSNSLTGTGSYFSVEPQNPTFNGTTGAYTATLAAFQAVNSSVTQLYSTPVACHNGMQVRTAILGTVAYIILDGNTMWVPGVTVSGMPGIGGRNMPSTNAISRTTSRRSL